VLRHFRGISVIEYDFSKKILEINFSFLEVGIGK
jgi:hypothetical protein